MRASCPSLAMCVVTAVFLNPLSWAREPLKCQLILQLDRARCWRAWGGFTRVAASRRPTEETAETGMWSERKPERSRLLGCDPVHSERHVPTFQINLLPPSLEWVNDSCVMVKEVIGYSETSVYTYQYTRRHIPQDSYFYGCWRGNLNSHQTEIASTKMITKILRDGRWKKDIKMKEGKKERKKERKRKA